MPDPFEKKILDESSEQKTFLTILESMDGITPQHISRQAFDDKCGDFLMDNNDGTHTLYLPTDITIAELPAIIRRVNRLTFGDKTPIYASSEELKVKIVITIDQLLNSISGKSDPDPQIKKAVKKYTQLYTQMFPEEEKSLSKTAYRKEIIDVAKQQEFKAYEEKLLLSRTGNSLHELKRNIQEVDDLLAGEVEKGLYESFYERGLSKLAQGLQTMTKQDVLGAMERGGYVSERVDSSELDKKEKLLREDISIDEYKKKLSAARGGGDQEEINQLTLAATNAILRALQKYPYQNDEEVGDTIDEYTPKSILSTKAMYCVGFSLVGSAFLQELGIEHYGLDIPGHSALALLVDNQWWYFDGAFNGGYELLKFHELGNKVGAYTLVDIESIGEKLIQIGDPEDILQSHIYNNKGVSLYVLGEYISAIDMYDKAIELNPKLSSVYYNKGNALYMLDENINAIQAYEKAMELNTEYTIRACSMILNIDPQNKNAYYNKGIERKNLGNDKLHNINVFVHNLLKDGKDSRGDFDIYYRPEKAEIRAYIKDQDYHALALYMEKLEENE